MNYGAALHSYAFQQYLKKKGVNSIIIDYIPKNMKGYNIKYPILNIGNFLQLRRFVSNIIGWSLGFFENIKKYNNFSCFFDEYTTKTKYKYTWKQLMSINDIENIRFDIFVSESDVIWKLYSDGDFDEVFFLYTPWAKGKKKVAYSPSLASRPFKAAEEKKFKEFISDFSAISCREYEGSVYLSEILNKHIPFVLDPTLLLNEQHYNDIAIIPREKKYLLCYNCMTNDKTMLKESQSLANKLGLELIEISNFNINKLLFKHKVLTNIGIREWLGYFANADFIVCNAFHGCCFAIIFKKEFFLFLRDNSDYRMQSLTRSLMLSERLIDINLKEIPKEFCSIDYKKVYDELKKLREKSENFIENNIIN